MAFPRTLELSPPLVGVTEPIPDLTHPTAVRSSSMTSLGFVVLTVFASEVRFGDTTRTTRPCRIQDPMSTTMSKPACRVRQSLEIPSTPPALLYASFLLGVAQSAENYIPLLTDGMRSQTLAVYLQDDWKVTPRLTLNLGLRWDIPTPLYEVRSRMSGLDPGKPNPGADGYRGAFVVLGQGRGDFDTLNWPLSIV